MYHWDLSVVGCVVHYGSNEFMSRWAMEDLAFQSESNLTHE